MSAAIFLLAGITAISGFSEPELCNYATDPDETAGSVMPVAAGNPVVSERNTRSATDPERRNKTRQVITEMALEALEQTHPPDEYRFSLSPRWIPGSLLGASPDQILSVKPVSVVERYTTFEVSRESENGLQKVEVQYAVEMEQQLPVAGRRLPGGKVLESSDLDVRWVSLTGSRNQMVRDVRRLEGKTVRRTLAPGQPVRKVDITRGYAVEAGDSVTMIFDIHGVRIDLTCEARQSGAVDEEIRVYSNETRKRYRGLITGPGVLEWRQTL